MVEFHEIKDFPGYRIGSDGSVWSCRTNGGKIGKNWKQMKPYGSRNRGGLLIALCRDGEKYRRHVHRLVLEAFLGACPPGMEGCHNNGDATDNHIENLRWDTHHNNMLDKIKHGTIAKGSRHGCAKLIESQILEIRWLIDRGISQDRLARLLNVSRRMINYISKGETWKI